MHSAVVEQIRKSLAKDLQILTIHKWLVLRIIKSYLDAKDLCS